VVKVSPVLSADPRLIDGRPRHLRGQLTVVNAATKTLTFNVKPFEGQSANVTTASALVNSNTRYEINGKPFAGDAGLAALATRSRARWNIRSTRTISSAANSISTARPTTHPTSSRSMCAACSIPGTSWCHTRRVRRSLIRSIKHWHGTL
jgi:hypothetical protein